MKYWVTINDTIIKLFYNPIFATPKFIQDGQEWIFIDFETSIYFAIGK
jgi:hypothetical protein